MNKRTFIKFISKILLWLFLFIAFLVATFPRSNFVKWVENRLEEKIIAEIDIKGVKFKNGVTLYLEKVYFKKTRFYFLSKNPG